MERVDITVTGRVQGVSFRWYTVRRARSLDLVGWVRNQPDGSVRIVAEGERGALEALVGWAELGPDHARVTSCRPTWQDATGQFETFEVAG